MNKREKVFILNCPCSSCSTKNQFECARVNYDELCERLNNWKMLVEYIEHLEKAIDDACEELASYDYRYQMSLKPNSYDCDYKDYDYWMEYFLDMINKRGLKETKND